MTPMNKRLEHFNESRGCPFPTLRRPTFVIEIPILLYRVTKGEWKIKRVSNPDLIKRRIYNNHQIAPKFVRAPYPDSIHG